MDGGPWLRSASREFLYRFSSTNDEYLLQVTDMSSVFEERLAAPLIEDRGEQLNCPFALDSEQQRQAFASMLAGLLASETTLFNMHLDSSVTVSSADEVPFHWRFAMHKLDASAAVDVFARLAAGLFGVVNNMNEHLARLDSQLADSGAIIRGLENANRRQTPYTVPRSLEPVYRSALGSSLRVNRFSDVTRVAQAYWPSTEVSVLESVDDEDTDSDATHESQSVSSGTVWAGSTHTDS